MRKRHIIYHDLTTEAGRKAFDQAYRVKHGLDPAPKTSALPLRIVFKELLPAERGKLGLCPSTRLEAFKATPFPGSFKLGPKQRLHRWLCDECGFWHGQAVNPEDDNLPPDEPTFGGQNEILTKSPVLHPDPAMKEQPKVGSRAGKISTRKKT